MLALNSLCNKSTQKGPLTEIYLPLDHGTTSMSEIYLLVGSAVTAFLARNSSASIADYYRLIVL